MFACAYVWLHRALNLVEKCNCFGPGELWTLLDILRDESHMLLHQCGKPSSGMIVAMPARISASTQRRSSYMLCCTVLKFRTGCMPRSAVAWSCLQHNNRRHATNSSLLYIQRHRWKKESKIGGSPRHSPNRSLSIGKHGGRVVELDPVVSKHNARCCCWLCHLRDMYWERLYTRTNEMATNA